MPPSLYLNKVPPAVAWESAALSVIKTPTTLNQDPGTPLFDITPPETQTLRAIAGNDTDAPITGVRVQFWAVGCSPVASPSLYLNSLNGEAGVTVPSGGPGVTLPGISPAVPVSEAPFDISWRPSSTDPQIETLFGGPLPPGAELHCCMLANVFSAVADRVDAQPPVLDIVNNRRHAQHNMMIKKRIPGDSMGIMMFVANPDMRREQEFVVEASEQPGGILKPWELERVENLAPWIVRRDKPSDERDPLSAFEIVLGDERRPMRSAEKPLRDLQVEIGKHCGPDVTLELGPDEPQILRLNGTLSEEDLVLRVFDVTQLQDGKTLGGVRVLALTVPEELLDKPRQPGEYGS